jgi:hypothetical protein
MTRSATDVMQDILYAAVIDGIVALKDASKGLPNTLLRDIGAVHANTTLADLPAELQASIQANVRAAFTRLLKEGYSVSPGQPAPARAAPPRRDGPAGPGGGSRRPPGNRDGAPPRSGPRPPRGGSGDGRPSRGGADGRPPRGGGGGEGRPPRGGKPRG